MKLRPGFKSLFLLTLVFLYLSGIATWILENWWQEDQGFGLAPSPWRLRSLQTHSIIGLWFLLVFGYFYRVHVEKGWAAGKKVWSGSVAFFPWILLILTVPGLFYLTNETMKFTAAQIHTWVGLVSVLPFLWHWLTKAGKG